MAKAIAESKSGSERAKPDDITAVVAEVNEKEIRNFQEADINTITRTAGLRETVKRLLALSR